MIGEGSFSWHGMVVTREDGMLYSRRDDVRD